MATLTEGKWTGEFLLSEAEGVRSRDTVTLIASAGALKAGTVLGKVTASGNYKAYAAGNSDGSQTAAAILYANVDNSAATQKVVVFTRDAEVISAELTGIDAAAKTALLANGIVCR